jgi:hypothetical protein
LELNSKERNLKLRKKMVSPDIGKPQEDRKELARNTKGRTVGRKKT